MWPDAGATEGDRRSASRYRLLFLGGGMAILGKSLSAVTTLISVPLTVHYLGVERFGMWMTISSLVTLVNFADFGIGNGLVSAVSHRDGQGDLVGIARYVSTAAIALTAVGFCLFALFCVAYSFVPWSRVFAVSSPLAVTEAGPATFAFVACFCANLPLAVSQRVQMGLQESWLSNLWLSAGNVFGLIGVLGAIHFHAGLPQLALGMCSGPVIAGILGGISEFWLRHPNLRPRLSLWSPQILPGLFRTGAIFFVLQILTVLGLGGLDNILVSTMTNAKTVAPFAVMLKYAQTTLVATVFLQPLWPAVGEALGRGDYLWARRALGQASGWTLVLGGIIGLFTALFGQTVIHLWSGLTPSPDLKYGFAACIVVLSYTGVVATFLNNELFVQRQLGILFTATLASIALKILGLRFWGIAAVPWATAFSFGIFFCLYGLHVVNKSFAELLNKKAVQCPPQ